MDKEKAKSIIREEIGNVFLSELAFPRNVVIDKFQNVSEEIMNHLIKIFVYPNSREINSWKKEIATFVTGGGSFILKNNKKLNSKKYYEILNNYIETEDDIENRYRIVVDNYNDNAEKNNLKSIENPIELIDLFKKTNLIREILTKISNYISKNKVLDRSEIIKLI